MHHPTDNYIIIIVLLLYYYYYYYCITIILLLLLYYYYIIIIIIAIIIIINGYWTRGWTQTNHTSAEATALDHYDTDPITRPSGLSDY